MEDSSLQTRENNTPNAILRYRWDHDWADQIVHNIPIAKVAEELSSIKEIYGEITPQILVDSSKNKKSVFYHYFEWDDIKAANAHRLHRASQILSHIEIKIIKDGKPVLLKPIEITSVQPFRNTKTSNKEQKEIDGSFNYLVKRGVINDLRILVNRLTRVGAPQTVIVLLNSTIDELHKEPIETKKESKSLISAVTEWTQEDCSAKEGTVE